MKNTLRIIFLFVTAFISFQCLPKIDEPVAPTYDVQMALPLLKNTYTLRDMISRDTSTVQIVDSSQEIFYRASSQSTPSTVGDKLQIHPVATDPINMNIGEFQVAVPGTQSQTVQLIDSIPPPPPPPFPQNFTIQQRDTNFSVALGNQISQFEFVKFSSGTIELTITNNLPVAIFPNNIAIINTGTNETVASFTTFSSIPPNTMQTRSFNLANGDTMRNSLSLTASIHSDTATVSLPLGPKYVTFTMSILNAKANAARAKVPQQDVGGVSGTTPFVIDDSTNNAQPTKINYARFKSGLMNFVIENHVDLNIGLKLKINEFRNKVTGDTLDIDTTIARFNSPSGGLMSIPIDMSKYELNFQGSATNSFTYVAQIKNLDSADSYRTVLSTDYVRATIIPDQTFILSSAEGKVTPFSTSVAESMSVNLTYIDPHFTCSIQFSGFQINLGLFIGGGVRADLNMQIIGVHSASGTRDTIDIPPNERSIYPNVLNTIHLNVDDFLSSFTFPNLPDKFIFIGAAEFNPDYQNGYIADTTSIYGKTDFEIPMKLGILSAEFKDTSEVETTVDRDNIKDVNSGAITFKFTNKLPLRVALNLKLVDSLYINTNGTSGSIFEQQFTVDAARFSTGDSTISVSKIGLKNSEIDAVVKGNCIIFSLQMETSGNTVVTFHADDKIDVEISAQLSYRVNNDSKSKVIPIYSSKNQGGNN